MEDWIWNPYIFLKGNKLALVKNDYAPFLKGQWILPGKARKAEQKPKKYDFQHTITHHTNFCFHSKR